MDEKWNFLMIAGDDGAEAQVRFHLESRGSGAIAELQVTMAGDEIPVDDAPIDYEAPEWKAKKLMAAAGIDEAGFEALKSDLRGRHPG